MLTDHCANDVVLDTCVLVHACKGGVEPEDNPALSALEVLWDHSSLEWVLDDNGKAAPALETSTLYAEYYASLSPQSFPLQILARMLQDGRISFSERPSKQLRDRIRKLIPGHKADQVILGAAANSRDRLLVSDNTREFARNRKKIYGEVDVRVLESTEL